MLIIEYKTNGKNIVKVRKDWTPSRIGRAYTPPYRAGLHPALKDDEWEFNEYRAKHVKSKMSLWNCSGRFFLKLEDERGNDVAYFNLVEKFVLWHYLKKRMETQRYNYRQRIAQQIITARLNIKD